MREKIEDFALGMAAAIAVPVVQAAVTFNEGVIDSPGPWLRGVLTGCIVAAGLYVRTRLAERGTRNAEPFDDLVGD